MLSVAAHPAEDPEGGTVGHGDSAKTDGFDVSRICKDVRRRTKESRIVFHLRKEVLRGGFQQGFFAVCQKDGEMPFFLHPVENVRLGDIVGAFSLPQFNEGNGGVLDLLGFVQHQGEGVGLYGFIQKENPIGQGSVPIVDFRATENDRGGVSQGGQGVHHIDAGKIFGVADIHKECVVLHGVFKETLGMTVGVSVENAGGCRPFVGFPL